ncbi:MAG: hypothetical protein KF851_02350 [Pirellulaceae bacterium]|nr:hypothetical protein [Pirellulaceae bacterium]
MRLTILRIGIMAACAVWALPTMGQMQQRQITPQAQAMVRNVQPNQVRQPGMDTGQVTQARVERMSSQPVGTNRVAPTRYVPNHARYQEGSIAAPMGSSMEPVPQSYQGVGGPRVVGGPSSASCASCSGGYLQGESVYGGCDSCGDYSGYGRGCGVDSYFDGCCDRGGCPEGLADCWLGKLGLLLYRGEYFAGAHGFHAPAFQPGTANNLFQDSSFGFHYGANLGVPLCRITCGLLSGQIGIRSVHSDFSGMPFSDSDRHQLFFTTGLYRRVDHGLQLGVVADFMEESWFVDSSLVQIRGETSWVFYGGNQLGFRFTKNVQDDVGSGVLNNVPVNNLITSSFESYRFFYRQIGFEGAGFSDWFLGWSEDSHFIGGIDFDVPITERTALQSSFTYFLPQDDAQRFPGGGNAAEAWNISVGFVFRPQGRCYYQNYDRPMFGVADNGTMVLRRGTQQ